MPIAAIMLARRAFSTKTKPRGARDGSTSIGTYSFPPGSLTVCRLHRPRRTIATRGLSATLAYPSGQESGAEFDNLFVARVTALAAKRPLVTARMGKAWTRPGMRPSWPWTSASVDATEIV